MSIRLPLKQVLDVDDAADVGAGSVTGGIPHQFELPQDTDNVVVKFTASTVGGAVSATFQTTDDGGTTWYDLARTSVVSNANATTAEWLNIPVNGGGFRSAVQGQNSVAGATNVAVILNTPGSAAASSLGQSEQSGLPIMSTTNRVIIQLTGDLTANALTRTKVLANSQTPGN
jgi:hypothetical protein